MPDSPRFRIMDLIVAVAAAGAGTAGISFVERDGNPSRVVATVFLMTVAAYAVFTYDLTRFGRRRSTQLVGLGIGLGFAAATIGVYSALYREETFVPVAGLMAIAVVLTLGGVAHGLLDHRHALRDSATTSSTGPHRATHPLAPDENR